jgi:ABC-2 type transport system ATP-binding protein
MQAPAIEARALTKIYRTYKKTPGFTGAIKDLFARQYTDTRAVDAVTFTIAPGEIVGFLGPNGAGKTTTLKMLAGLLHPTSGTATVLGHIPWLRSNDFKRRFSLVMGQKNQLWWDLPAAESLELNRVIYGIPRQQARRTISHLADILGVTHKLTVMVRELSLGERMKFELIAALLHQPSVLLLDEPTIGLDVISQRTVREFLAHYRLTHPLTILLTSHYMQDVRELCRRVIIIDGGRLCYDGSLQGIIDRFSSEKIIALTVPDHSARRAFLAAHPSAQSDGASIRLRVPRSRVADYSRQFLAEIPLTDISIEDIPLEDAIRALFKQNAS